MLNIKEAAEQLNMSGITASEEEVLRWIEEGQIKADIIQRRKITYKITGKDLTEFIIQNYTAHLTAQLERSQRENRNLTEELELLKTRIQIEQSKVRTLKKLLNEQIEANNPSQFPYGKLLGLKDQGSINDRQMLKKEFKKLLKALHPDRGGDERLFKVFNDHYENLK